MNHVIRQSIPLYDLQTQDPLFYRRSFFARMIVSAVKWMVRFLLRLFFRFKVEGLENLPPGPYLVCPNHLSDIDPLLLYAVLPDETLYIAYEGNFRKPPLSWIVRYARIVLTTPAGRVPRCLVRSRNGLKSGFSVCVFPEGQRSRTGNLMEPKAGAAILSIQANVPIVPVRIHGSQDVLSRVRPGFRLCKVRIVIGKPIFPTTNDCSALLQSWKKSISQLCSISEGGPPCPPPNRRAGLRAHRKTGGRASVPASF